MVDAHCHLNDESIKHEEIETLISRAREAGVDIMVCNGAGISSSRRAIEIANEYKEVYATVGVHPETMDEYIQYGENAFEDLLKMIENSKVVGIGEAGIDITENTTNEEIESQKRLFEFNIRLAKTSGLPLIIHCRNAYEIVYDMIVKTNCQKGMLHCFVGDEAWMKKFVDIGFYISYGGILTFRKSDALRKVAKATPLEYLLTETDSPYLSPEPMRGNINEPKNVGLVVGCLAEVTGKSREIIIQATETNVKNCFVRII